MTKMAAMPIYGKHFKDLLSIHHWEDLMKLRMMNKRPKPFIISANYDPWLTLTYFTTKSNFATWAFTWENVTIMYSLEFIASCDLEFS